MNVRAGRRVLASVYGAAILLAGGCLAEPQPLGQTALAATTESSLIARGEAWTYWAQPQDLGTAWRAKDWTPTYPGTTGPGPLGYGETYLATTVPYGPDASNRPPTVYFRKTFYVENPGPIVGLRLDAMYDDGLVYYVNGVEVGRLNMPTGAIAYGTLTGSHEAQNLYYGSDATAARHLLVAGWNTIAVEVHQQALSSSDLVFDAGLVAQLGSPAPAPEAGGVARAGVWSYWDRGGDLGTAWRAGNFDASGWANGAAPLGYGETYLATTVSYGPSATEKHVTTYFRKQFTIAEPAQVTSLQGELMFDDGLVVYLNGQAIQQDSMPTGPVTASTYALGREAGNAYVAHDWTAAKNLLVAGVNTLAVEVHQQSASSSDLVFDLALHVQAGPPPTGTLDVCKTGAPYVSVGAAVSAAAPGATIRICPGTYVERVSITGKPLTIVGTGGAGVTILDGSSGGSVLTVASVGGAGVSLKGVTLRHGKTGGQGGGLRCSASTLTVDASVIADSQALGGGGLYASGCDLDVTGTSFTGNRASDQGGGALVVGSSGVVATSTFTANQAEDGGGLTVQEGSVVLQGNTIRANTASVRGGGLYHESNAAVTGNTIADNTSGWTGGGIHTVVHAATFSKNVVSGNHSENDGGGVYIHQGEPVFRDNTFTGNDSGDDGGGVRAFESHCRLEDNLIQANVASDTGGGVRVSHLPCQIIDNTVTGNQATNTGGGLDLDNDASVVRGGEITGNSAAKGGGIFMWLSPWNGGLIENVRIAGNDAWRGGGLHLDDNFQPITLRGLTVEDNTAAEGGGFYVRGTTFTLDHSLFRGNQASSKGGAMYTGANGHWNEPCPCPSTTPKGKIDFVVAFANEAPSGAALWTSFGSLNVASSIFFASTGGPQVVAGGAPDTPTVIVPPIYRYNDTFPATFGGFNPSGTNGNLAVHPLFVDAGGGNFHLQATSKCVNAGDPAILDANGTRADMGLYGGK